MTELFTASTTTDADDTNKDYLAELVGDDKKFKTPADLARGKAEADRFITQLQEELAGIRQDLNTRVTLEAFMDKINDKQGTTQTPNDDSNNQQTSTNGDKPLTAADIERLLEERVAGLDAKRRQEANVETAKAGLIKAFGNDYVNQLKTKTQALGLTEEFMSNLAKDNPKGFLSIVGVTEQTSRPAAASSLFTPPTSSTSTSFTPTGEKGKSYYDSIRKADPAKYWSPEVQNQMHKDAIRIGPSFFET